MGGQHAAITMQQRNRGVAHLAVSCPPRHLQMRLDQMRHGAADAAMAVTQEAAMVRSGHFSRDGAMPLNTHGGLLSYGHCGVGGAMAHLVEAYLQMTGRAGNRQVKDASVALLHGDGGVLSSHVSMFLERVR